MKFNFRKIASAASSALMVSSTVALAAAANYPAPFVSGGNADVALVYGSSAASSDLVAAIDITSNLQSYLGSSSGGTDTTVEGEAYELFTSGSPLLLNSTLDSVRDTISASHLPTTLEDGTFEGQTNIDYTQRIIIGSNPVLAFKQQPTSSDDARLGFTLSTTPSSSPIYNTTVTFNENVNFTHADSSGERLELFGEQFTVSSATTTSKLVLLMSSQEITLTNTNPSAEVSVDGETYTVELISASDTDANIRVTDSTGASSSSTVDEASSKTIQGLEVGVDAADENNFQLTATLLIGSSRVTLQDASAVKTGTDEDTIEGTLVQFEQTDGTADAATYELGKIIIQVAAMDSDDDAFFPGSAFVDPVFGSFKLDFSGVSVPVDSSSRETISVQNSGDDAMSITMMSHDGSEAKTVDWVYNNSAMDLADDEGDRIIVAEMGSLNRSEYIVLASDKEGGLYEVTAVHNASTGFSDDYVRLKNVFTGEETSDLKATSEGVVSGVTEQGKTYTINYYGSSTSSQDDRTIRVNYDESSGNDMILFPTIRTSNGAKVAFYEPTTVTVDNWNGAGDALANVTNFKLPDGDGYTDIAVGHTTGHFGNYTFGGNIVNLSAADGVSSTGALAVGKLNFNISSSGTAQVAEVFLISPEGGNIDKPALIMFEEQDDANNYEALVVTLDAGFDGDDAGIGVNEVVRTWSTDALNNEVRLESDSDLYQEMDIWGTLITLDKGDSDQTTAMISYPNSQLEASVYIASNDAVITGGSAGGQGGTLGSITVRDDEVSQVSSKNLILIGGSCVNSVAASLLGSDSPLCGDDFEDATGVSSGSFLIETFDSPYTSGKVATVVAGYNAADTTTAAQYLRTQTVDTTVGMKYIGTTASSAELVTE